MQYIDVIGFLALALASTSFFAKGRQWARWIGVIGAVVLVLYGVLIVSFPVALLGAVMATAQVFEIKELRNKIVRFTLVDEYYRPNCSFDVFYENHKIDILKFFPKFRTRNIYECEIELVYHNMTVAGAFVYQVKDEELYVFLDYMAPEFRDLPRAERLFTMREDKFRRMSISKMIAFSTIAEHTNYLKTVGFVADKQGSNVFEKKLAPIVSTSDQWHLEDPRQ